VEAREIDTIGTDGIIKKIKERVGTEKPVYLSIDIDTLDPACECFSFGFGFFLGISFIYGKSSLIEHLVLVHLSSSRFFNPYGGGQVRIVCLTFQATTSGKLSRPSFQLVNACS
jgi:hypothetical protein